MFAKLLKYDMKATKRIGIPMLIGVLAVIVLSVINSLFGAFISDVTYLELEELPKLFQESEGALLALTVACLLGTLASYLLNVICTALLSASVIAIIVINLVNFYKSLITDEGYLAFTLPVSQSEILSSKIINAIIWDLSFGALYLVGFLASQAPTFIRTIYINMEYMQAFDPDFTFWDSLTMQFGLEGVNGFNILAVLLLFVAFYIAITIALQIFMFFTVFLGGVVAKKRKFLASIGFTAAGYGTYYVVELIIVGIILAVCIVFLFVADAEVITGLVAANLLLLSVNVILLISIIVLVGLSVLFYFLTKWLMTKKLNLP